MFRRLFYLASAIAFVSVALLALRWPGALHALWVLVPLFALGLQDALQRRQAVRRNWPLIGRFRYLFEMIRPEIQQYFVESNTDGTPVSRELRSVVYQRAKHELDTLPFGTQRNVYAPGYEWICHSIAALPARAEVPRVRFGPDRARPYDGSLLHISAMSYGSLSRNAIRALNEGARRGGFAHNTGEGGLSPHHLEPGGDLIWQIGTGYFGCRAADGTFDAGAFRERARHPHVKMIEVKLSQGAKPGHGGILPARKVTPEIAAIRGVPLGRDVLSPPAHSAFRTPRELVLWIEALREAAEGRPVGLKLCVGDPSEFLAILKAMRATGTGPDYIAVDGGEGGTGAAPLEFSNRVGTPLREGLLFVRNALVATGLRDRVRIVASGKSITGFHMFRARALGADVIASARGMMFALGCIQARRCNSNSCPVGVATQREALVHGLDIEDKAARVVAYHEETVEAFLELLGAAGLEDPAEIAPHHVWRRVDEVLTRHYGELYTWLEAGQLLDRPETTPLAEAWVAADPDAFRRRAASRSA
jgi:glutamate synthase domain-containing protein 2